MPDRNLQRILADRYSDAPDVGRPDPQNVLLHSMAARGSCRTYLDRPIPPELTDLLCATALAAPTKSDLQQRDIILLHSADVRQRLAELVPDQTWVADAPMIAVFCGNNRRQRLLHDWKGIPFANDHLDAFFNAVGDAAIALGAFVTAAEALGLGCCPISAVRNDATAVSTLLNLPQHVFPFAGLAFGYPSAPSVISPRLPRRTTCHVNRYDEEGLQEDMEHYATARATTQPYVSQRLAEVFGTAKPYTWSDDKVRQYSQPERAAFGAFVRAKGFKLT